MDVTFCFIVTTDLVKEQIWRKWLDRLRELGLKINVITHCSPAQHGNIKSDWLGQTILPADYLRETAWAWIMNAILSMYKYAITHSPSSWYTLHSESCLPCVSPEKFIENFNAYKQHSFLSYSKAWWTPMNVRNDRANLHLLPPDYHYAHAHLSILCQEDLSQMITLSETNHTLTTILQSGHTADESWIAVFLYKINNFKNVINKLTTITDWKRTPNGNNPYTFMNWTDADKAAVAEMRADKSKNEYMFIRKIGETFPDAVLLEWLGLAL
jgi:hypothetical protein